MGIFLWSVVLHYQYCIYCNFCRYHSQPTPLSTHSESTHRVPLPPTPRSPQSYYSPDPPLSTIHHCPWNAWVLGVHCLYLPHLLYLEQSSTAPYSPVLHWALSLAKGFIVGYPQTCWCLSRCACYLAPLLWNEVVRPSVLCLSVTNKILTTLPE